MQTRDLHFDLPSDRIATQPAEPRDAAKLMVIHRPTQTVHHHHVRDLPDLAQQFNIFQPGDLMVVNQTRVLPAYLHGTRRQTNGKVTGLFLNATPATPQPDTPDPQPPFSGRSKIAPPPNQPPNPLWTVLLESGGKLTPNEFIDLDDSAALQLKQSLGRGEWQVELINPTNDSSADTPLDTMTVLNRVGNTPLPPYIRKARKHADEPELTDIDAERYNTVYAAVQQAGSVAAPTAGLHFTPQLLQQLDDMGVIRVPVTLHVGAGTFAPVRTDSLDDHDMHAEWLEVDSAAIDALRTARDQNKTITAIGTTSVRTLESLPTNWRDLDHYTAETKLFIRPDANNGEGFNFRFTDQLLTNFHLPESTLLALVAALPNLSLDQLKAHYQEAINQNYRFYSYGDAMLII